MFKIIVSGPAAAFEKSGSELSRIADAARLRKLDGISYDEDVCSDYLDGTLDDIGLKGGALRIRFDEADGALRVETEYSSPRKLKPAELRALARDTEGQWSDGIGEGCFDDHERKNGIRIDPSPMDDRRKVRIEQTSDGQAAPAADKLNGKLLSAVRRGKLDAVRKALDAGADVNASRQGFSALASAVSFGHVEVALLLIERGANVEARDKLGGTPLHTCALSSGIADEPAAIIARSLLAHGANVNALSTLGLPAYGALDYAINRRKQALQEVLRGAGARQNVKRP